jgi:signal transduction histidine kinase
MSILAGGAVILLAAAAFWFTHFLTRDFAASRVRTQLDSVQRQVEHLADDAVHMNQVTRRRINPNRGLTEQFGAFLGDMADVFELHSEISYVGIGVERTGDYAMLERIPGSGKIRCRESLRNADGTGRTREFIVETGIRRPPSGMPWDGYDPRTRPFYLAAKAARQPVWTEAYAFWQEKDKGAVPGVSYAVPISDARGTLAGVLDVDFDLLDLSRYLAELSRTSEGYSFILEQRADGRWSPIAHPNPTQLINPATHLFKADSEAIPDPVLRSVLRLARENKNFGLEAGDGIRVLRADGMGCFWTARRLGGINAPRWTIVTVLPTAVLGRETHWLYVWLGSAAFILLGLSALIAARMARHVAEPLQLLERQLADQASQSSPRPVQITGSPEFVRLGQAFNRLAEGLDQRQSELTAANAALQAQVLQREQAEAALREHQNHLEDLVRERTSELSRINLVLASEVHERKRAEEELVQANAQLKELDRLKSEFLATMSHELRTPLNSIIGFSGILRQRLAGPLTPEQDKQLGMVQSSARHLLGLINDLLDLSRLESGKMDLHLSQFAAGDVLQEVITTLEPMARAKQLPLRLELDNPGLTLESDRKKVFQILLNLANNAVKFTERGEITLRVTTENGHARFLVRDTGIGIRPEHLGLLFEAFRQVDGSARRVYEGTGLGLYLCRKLAGLLGGDISAKSEFGKGSEFCFTIPAGHRPKA